MTTPFHLPTLPKGWPQAIQDEIREAWMTGRMSQIRSALHRLDSLSDRERGRTFQLAIASTFTLEPQLDALRLMLASYPSRPGISLTPLGNIEQELLNPKSNSLFQSPDAVLILWRLEELHPRLVAEGQGWSAEARSEALQEIIVRIHHLCTSFSRVATAPLFLSTLPQPLNVPLVGLHLPNGLPHLISRINSEILNLAAQSKQIYVFDFAGWASKVGEKAFDPKMDLFVRQPIAGDALVPFSDVLRRTFRPLFCPRLKVLALDLDHTLWGGVLGEEGVNGLKIGHDYPGNVYLRIQQLVLGLKQQGVLLVLLSKNDLKDVTQAFRNLPDMVLRLDDFTKVRVNWRPKYENLREIAQELNLGLDSFLFVDDEAFEREEMAYHLSEVQVLAVNQDPLNILRTLATAETFETFRVGEEDRFRSQHYTAEGQRRAFQEKKNGNVEDFLKSLDIEVTIASVNESNLPRVVQMLGKTNQFNVTTRRHTEAEIRRFMSSPRNILLTLKLRDRFGDQGIVGLALALTEPAQEKLYLDSFLLSCRAIGRGCELALWSELLARASQAGYLSLNAEYLATEKNRQVADLFDRLGMKLVTATAENRRYELRLPASSEGPAWMKINRVPHEQYFETV